MGTTFDVSQVALNLALGIAGGATGALLVQQRSPAAFMAPSPDSKIEQAYMRSGISEPLMGQGRRGKFSECCECSKYLTAV